MDFIPFHGKTTVIGTGTMMTITITMTSPKDPSLQVIPTYGSKVCKYYLHCSDPWGNTTGMLRYKGEWLEALIRV